MPSQSKYRKTWLLIFCAAVFCVCCIALFAPVAKKASTKPLQGKHFQRKNKFLWRSEIYKHDGLEIVYEWNEFGRMLHIKGSKVSGAINMEGKCEWCNANFDVKWVNDDYICLLTGTDGDMGDFLFIPMQPQNELQYFPKHLKHADSLTNNILLIDKGDDEIWLRVQNLMTHKKDSLLLDPSRGVYPFFWFDAMTPSKLRVHTIARKYELDIRQLSR